MRRISGTTRVIAILGDPVEHSRSPVMHNAAFAKLGLDYVYVALRVRPNELRRAVAGIRSLGFAGLNVTVPHKEAILPLLDRLSPAARAIGAVNTVVRQGERLIGHNTDAEGFRESLRRTGFRGVGKTAVVLGAGGSARAVVWALQREGVHEITVLNRDVARARALAAGLPGSSRRVALRSGPLADAARAELLEKADLVVNCTSLGLDGRSRTAIALRSLSKHCLVYDLVYGSRPTPLVKAARRQGLKAIDGLDMLIAQAGLAFRLWTRRDPPKRTMTAALRAKE